MPGEIAAVEDRMRSGVGAADVRDGVQFHEHTSGAAAR